VAAAFSVGVFIGMSPLLGIHTVLGIALAYQFKLNRLVTLVGVYITNPWTIVPIYTFGTWVGIRLLGLDNAIPPINWHHITFFSFVREFRALLLPFLVGNTFMAFVAAVAGYVLIHQAVKRSRRG
jgi:uncharacterized protein (DUF2062 family)